MLETLIIPPFGRFVCFEFFQTCFPTPGETDLRLSQKPMQQCSRQRSDPAAAFVMVGTSNSRRNAGRECCAAIMVAIIDIICYCLCMCGSGFDARIFLQYPYDRSDDPAHVEGSKYYTQKLIEAEDKPFSDALALLRRPQRCRSDAEGFCAGHQKNRKLKTDRKTKREGSYVYATITREKRGSATRFTERASPWSVLALCKALLKEIMVEDYPERRGENAVEGMALI